MYGKDNIKFIEIVDYCDHQTLVEVSVFCLELSNVFAYIYHDLMASQTKLENFKLRSNQYPLQLHIDHIT